MKIFVLYSKYRWRDEDAIVVLAKDKEQLRLTLEQDHFDINDFDIDSEVDFRTGNQIIYVHKTQKG